jgi:hypothetical protein
MRTYELISCARPSYHAHVPHIMRTRLTLRLRLPAAHSWTDTGPLPTPDPYQRRAGCRCRYAARCWPSAASWTSPAPAAPPRSPPTWSRSRRTRSVAPSPTPQLAQGHSSALLCPSLSFSLVTRERACTTLFARTTLPSPSPAASFSAPPAPSFSAPPIHPSPRHHILMRHPRPSTRAASSRRAFPPPPTAPPHPASFCLFSPLPASSRLLPPRLFHSSFMASPCPFVPATVSNLSTAASLSPCAPSPPINLSFLSPSAPPPGAPPRLACGSLPSLPRAGPRTGTGTGPARACATCGSAPMRWRQAPVANARCTHASTLARSHARTHARSLARSRPLERRGAAAARRYTASGAATPPSSETHALVASAFECCGMRQRTTLV